MKPELIAPAAAIAAVLLQDADTDINDPAVIGSAFETAYLGLLDGIQRVRDSDKSVQATVMKLGGL